MESIKLHLGCGLHYLRGYINIDYPASKHTVASKLVADKYADITKLRYSNNSVAEIRLHHVFEHFSIAQACALLVVWTVWLKQDGKLRIEVPDFKASIIDWLNPFIKKKNKYAILRHLYGSQEAEWATHKMGWSSEDLSYLLMKLGYEVISVKKTKGYALSNFDIIAKKLKKLNVEELQNVATGYMKNYLVTFDDLEMSLYKVWVKDSDKIVKSGLKNGNG